MSYSITIRPADTKNYAERYSNESLASAVTVLMEKSRQSGLNHYDQLTLSNIKNYIARSKTFVLKPEEIIQKQFNIQNYLNAMSTFYPLTDGVYFCMMLTGSPLKDISSLESIIEILSQYRLETVILPETVQASRHNPFERILQVASEYTQSGRACHESEGCYIRIVATHSEDVSASLVLKLIWLKEVLEKFVYINKIESTELTEEQKQEIRHQRILMPTPSDKEIAKDVKGFLKQGLDNPLALLKAQKDLPVSPKKVPDNQYESDDTPEVQNAEIVPEAECFSEFESQFVQKVADSKREDRKEDYKEILKKAEEGAKEAQEKREKVIKLKEINEEEVVENPQDNLNLSEQQLNLGLPILSIFEYRVIL